MSSPRPLSLPAAADAVPASRVATWALLRADIAGQPGSGSVTSMSSTPSGGELRRSVTVLALVCFRALMTSSTAISVASSLRSACPWSRSWLWTKARAWRRLVPVATWSTADQGSLVAPGPSALPSWPSRLSGAASW